MVKKSTKKKEFEISKNKLTNENRILRNLLFTFVIILIVIAGFYFYTQSQIHFKYKGIEFTREDFCDVKPCIITYKTSVPVSYNGAVVPYNFYFRTKPTDLNKVNFDTENFELMKSVVYSEEGNFSCDGYGSIAVANLANLYKVIGVNIMKDENATCDAEGRYTYLTVKEGDETKIVQVGNQCYDIYVKDCEVLPALEKIMAEVLVKLEE